MTFFDSLSFEPDLSTVLLNLSHQANRVFTNEMKTALTQWTLF